MSKDKFLGIRWLMSAALVGAVMLAGISPSGAAEPVVLNGDAINLERGFTAPPPSARPFVFWFWMGEAVTKEGITADLEAMARFGIGGYIIFHASGYQAPDLPNTKMLSPEWFELFKHTMRESDRLGLEGGINNCPGYATDGGPWVTPEFGQQEVVWSEAIVEGGAKVTARLPEPAVKQSWGRKFNYSDIATMAIPLPEEGAQDFRALVKNVTCSGVPEQAKLDFSVYKEPGIKVDFPPENPDARALVDGRLDTGFQIPLPGKDNPLVIEYELSEPFTARGFEIAFLPVIFSSPTHGAVVIEADPDGSGYRKVGEFALQAHHTLAMVAPRHFLKLDPVVAKKFRVTLSDARLNFGSKHLLPSEMVFHSLPRSPLADHGYSSLSIRDVKYERSKEPAKRLGFDAGQTLDLTSKMAPDGTLDWDAPPGRWLVMRFGHSCTGQTNHPPPPGMDGLEIDKLSKEAYDLHWEKGIKPYIDAAGDLAGRVFTTIHRDSPECGNHHWTPKMPVEFERRRGYSILPFLPVFAGVAPVEQVTAGRFQGDVNQTLADLSHEYNYDYSHELIRKHGLKSSSEAYSRVFSSTMAPRTADIPMSEVWLRSYYKDNPLGRSEMFSTSMTRTMAAVIQQHGQRYVGCEAFTQGYKPPDFWAIPYEDHPGSAKWRGDQMMADGVNRFYVHDFTHQPYLDRAPGVTYAGWGWNFDRNQTWWNLGAGTGAYWARCHWMLQEGKTAYDVCVWSPNETFYGAHAVGAQNWKLGGYDYTFLGNDVFLQRGAVDGDGYFTTGPGLRYRILTGVFTQTMSVAELRKLAGLIEDGAVFVGGAPQSPKGLKENQQEFNELVQRIWGGVDPEKGKPLGKGHVYDLGWHVVSKGSERISEYLLSILKQYLPPDFEVPGEVIRGEREGFTFQHRRSPDAEWYFVSNQKPEAKRVDCIFRVSGKHPELWNPITGETEQLNEFEVTADGRLRVPLDFAPDGACFVVFRKPLNPSHQIVSVAGDRANMSIANGQLRARAKGKWEITRADGDKRTVEIKDIPEPVAISGPWEVSFQAHRGAPPTAQFPELKSWSEQDDPGIRYFSGEALCRTTFILPKTVLAAGQRLHLDLGEVGVIAGVTLNGKALTPLWTPPFRLEVTSAAKAGENNLEIRVANTWLNRIIYSLKNPDDPNSIIFNESSRAKDGRKGLTKDTPAMWTNFPISYYKEKLNAETPLTRSGLIGPVRLMAERVVSLDDTARP